VQIRRRRGHRLGLPFLLPTIPFELITIRQSTVLGWGSMGLTGMHRNDQRCHSVLRCRILGTRRVKPRIIRTIRNSSSRVRQRRYSQRDRHCSPRLPHLLFMPMAKQSDHHRARADQLWDRLWTIEPLSSFMRMALRTSSPHHTFHRPDRALPCLLRHG
jgi:hypothetical protein